MLSVLIASINGREEKLAKLLKTLEPQVENRQDVEVLVLPDMRSMSIGEKRNRLVSLASGEYISFVDDDDTVTSDYVAAIVSVLVHEKPDVLCFLVRVQGHGREKLCRYHPSFTHENLPHEYRRKPNHIMVWRRELVCLVPFPSIRFGEDTLWAEKIFKLAKKVSVINRSLYSYQYDPRDNAAMKRSS